MNNKSPTPDMMVNYQETESLALSPYGVQLIQKALDCFERHDVEPWEIALLRSLQDNLRKLKQPNVRG